MLGKHTSLQMLLIEKSVLCNCLTKERMLMRSFLSSVGEEAFCSVYMIQKSVSAGDTLEIPANGWTEIGYLCSGWQ